ncbi:cysteine--tRNA ligase [Shimia sagamensis]|uniref:Cysteine--tRNA ligase n=1 Tax=Shimia sagamensis TaxID=1566352 RepID=A0ABY1NLG7_9RHOB|nr:cysteine--tRNA ligase [Shimia sagamensis]SMP12542.1 cysteinyl-tRNA synthetase [Shimia sagamensis]
MTEIKLHNTLKRQKEVFEPIDPENVRMYVCGPTVYDRAHIGNARPVVVFDVLYRLLREVYGADHVTYVRNFTDVDDKINTRAAESGRSIGEITAETTQWYLDDMGALGAMEPNHMPRATQYIGEMITMIEKLIADGFAYAHEGHVLFRVRKYDNYGKLSGRSVDDMIAGARVEVASYKEDPMDFVLWKPSNAEQPGWESPWGRGRPGWHIECSAMADELLWKRPLEAGVLSEAALAAPHVIDIHGGGNDLMFPHHENEVAQSCCANTSSNFANYWLHNEMLQVEGKKMSKSLGNFFTVRDLLDQGVSGEVIRFVFLGTHYSKPMDWTEKKRKEAQADLDHWMRRTIELDPVPASEFTPDQRLVDALADDLNTHLAITYLRALHNDPQKLLDNARWLGFLGDESRKQFKDNSLTGYHIFTSFPISTELGNVLVAASDNFRDAYKQAKETKSFDKVDRFKKFAASIGLKLSVSADMVTLDMQDEPSSDLVECLKSEVEALK